MKFEWAENKRLSNIRKHGLDFADARYVFRDINALISGDIRQEYDEERFMIIGTDNKGIICVVSYTLRGESYRIISLRNATKKEMEVYYGN